MSNKKILFSVASSAIVASVFVATEDASASSSHKVASGDSLWKIAQSNGVSVANLKKWNNLQSDLIFPKQVLQLKKSSGGSSNSSSSSSSSNSSSNNSSGSTYTVKSGDTLSGIAFSNGVSVKNIMSWNNLNSTLIYPGNKLSLKKGSSSSSSSSSSNSSSNSSSSNNSSSNSSTYTVKSGDTLSKIAANHGTSASKIANLNNISLSKIIHIGDKLKVSGKATSSSSSSNSSSSSSTSKAPTKAPAQNTGFSASKLMSAGESVRGTKYVWGGTTKSGGFDCSGFIYWAYNDAGKSLPRTSTDGYYNRSYDISKSELEVGDLVFFKGTYRAGISHMGIYVGNNQMMHAGSSTGVTTTSLDNSYWSKHFDSFKRFY